MAETTSCALSRLLQSKPGWAVVSYPSPCLILPVDLILTRSKAKRSYDVRVKRVFSTGC